MARSLFRILLFLVRSIYRITNYGYYLVRGSQFKVNLITFLTQNQIRLPRNGVIQLRYGTIALLLFFLLILLFIYSCFSPADVSQPHLPIIDIHVKPLKRLSKARLIHIEGSVKHLGEASPIYIINLPSRSDRRQRSIDLAKILHFDTFIVPAYSIDSPEIVSRAHLIRPRTTLFDYNFLTIFELACWASHMQVWLEIVATKSKNTWSVIFEDDIDLEMDTFEIMASFPQDLWKNTDIIYLGHCNNPPGSIMYEGTHGHRVHQALNPLCTHAYAIRSDAARKLIRLLATPVTGIDREIASQIDAQKIVAYSIHPPLAIQRPISSLNPSNVQVQNMDKLSYQIEKFLFSLSKWWRGVHEPNELRNSALAKANISKAEKIV